MPADNRSAADFSERTLRIERLFDAPRDLVFRAWTQPEHIVHWWGPRGCTSTVLTLELRLGGAYRIHMRSPEGTDHWSQGAYREVAAPERLVMAGCWTDAQGNPTSPETVLTVTFEEHQGKTRVTLHQVFESIGARDSHFGGWTSSLDRLMQYLANA